MKRIIPLALIAIFATLQAGCDSNDNREGRADVIALPVFTFNVAGANADGNFLIREYEVPDITSGVTEFGAVLAYFYDFQSDTWTAMPYTYGVESANEPLVDYTATLGYAFSTRTLQIFYDVSVPDVTVIQDELASQDIKVIIIRNRDAGKTGPDLTDYEEVVRYYGLEE